MKVSDYSIQLYEIKCMMMEILKDSDGDAGFTKSHVNKCVNLLKAYLRDLCKLDSPTNESIMACVKKTVLAINDLSEQTDYSMIETMEREAIWEVIQTAAVDCGLKNPPDDVTGEWRDW